VSSQKIDSYVEKLRGIILRKHIVKIIAASMVTLTIGVPSSVYAYNSYNYNKYFSSAQELMNNESYEEAEASFNLALKYKKKQSQAVAEQIDLITKLKDYKKVYDSGLNELKNAKYLEAASIFEGIKEDAGEKYKQAQEKAAEAKRLFVSETLEKAGKLALDKNYLEGIKFLEEALKVDTNNAEALKAKADYAASYISDSLNKAKKEASDKRYAEAIKTLDSVFAMDSSHSEAQKLKADYNKAIQTQKDEAAAKAAAVKVTAAAKPSTASKTSAPAPQLPPGIIPKPNPYITQRPAVSQVQGRDAIVNEFKKMGFVFSSNTTAMYSKNGIDIGLLDRGDLWQIATKVWGADVEDLFSDSMTILVGKDGADTGQFLINQVFDYDGVHQQGNVKAFINNNMLIVHITKD
jgi:tetratricopeptide (TPR) repeat protein